ncbi:uncharacterized protein VTP21DRAFT_3762 [Calcarisporiella thermophila]|uniref:uncharacterized protein n=1 Tax=Calcarisporiella thermophila TaxID=911321 RepID=UPI003742B1F0
MIRPFHQHSNSSRTSFYRIAIPILLVLAIGAAISITIVENNKDAEKDQNFITFQDISSVEEFDQLSRQYALGLYLKVIYIDLEKSILKTKGNAYIAPGFRDFVVANNLTRNARILINGDVIELNQRAPTIAKDLELEFESGDTALYPFDGFDLHIIIEGFGEKNNGTEIYPLTPMPIVVQVGSVQHDYRFNVQLVNTMVENQLEVGYLLLIHVAQTQFVKWFSIFLSVLMWLIALLAASVTYQIVVYQRSCSLEDVAVPSALLFALPSIRQTMPGVPKDVGTHMDVLGFIWNIAILSLCVVVSFSTWLVRYKKEKRRQAREINSSEIIQDYMGEERRESGVLTKA